MGEKYPGYQKALNKLEMESLDDSRERLCLNFARKSAKNPKTCKMFPLKFKDHEMKTRNLKHT